MIQRGDHAVGFCDIVRSTALDVVGVDIASAILVEAIALRRVTVAGGDRVVVVCRSRNFARRRNAGAIACGYGSATLVGSTWDQILGR